ncbi:unnamed protein product [Rhizopus stolonifer]
MIDPSQTILDAERRRVTSRQLLSIEIEEDNIQAAKELLQNQRSTRSKRRSVSEINAPTAKKNKVFPDLINIAGLSGSLGKNLARLGEEIQPDSNESRYFCFLSKNGIIDLTDSTCNSQLTQLGGPHIRNFLNQNYAYKLPDLKNLTNVGKKFNEIVKKIRPANLTSSYNTIDTQITSSPQERVIKDIYRHILQQHAFKGHMLTDNYFLNCSELSTITKYWSPILESYFGEKKNLFVQWGDTLSVDCKSLNLNYKLDLRMVVGTERGPVEAATGEFASDKATTEGKLYRDKLKSVLASKCHLNALLEKLSFLPVSQVSNIRLPILQVMGQSISLYVISSIDKQVYAVQNVIDAEYPRNVKMVRDGGIAKILNLFEHVDYFIESIEEDIKNYSRDTSNKMKAITGGSNSRKFKAEEWTSEVKWEPCFAEEY